MVPELVTSRFVLESSLLSSLNTTSKLTGFLCRKKRQSDLADCLNDFCEVIGFLRMHLRRRNGFSCPEAILSSPLPEVKNR